MALLFSYKDLCVFGGSDRRLLVESLFLSCLPVAAAFVEVLLRFDSVFSGAVPFFPSATPYQRVSVTMIQSSNVDVCYMPRYNALMAQTRP